MISHHPVPGRGHQLRRPAPDPPPPRPAPPTCPAAPAPRPAGRGQRRQMRRHHLQEIPACAASHAATARRIRRQRPVQDVQHPAGSQRRQHHGVPQVRHRGLQQPVPAPGASPTPAATAPTPGNSPAPRATPPRPSAPPSTPTCKITYASCPGRSAAAGADRHRSRPPLAAVRGSSSSTTGTRPAGQALQRRPAVPRDQRRAAHRPA